MQLSFSRSLTDIEERMEILSRRLDDQIIAWPERIHARLFRPVDGFRYLSFSSPPQCRHGVEIPEK